MATPSAGKALDNPIRTEMERLFQHDFGRVRVHPEDDRARHVGAHAFTVGTDIVFAPGAFAPDRPAGRRLLIHELTHVLQQQHAQSRSGAVGSSGDVHEHAARAASDLAMLTGWRHGALAAIVDNPARIDAVPHLQRQERTEQGGHPEADDPNFLLCLILCYLGIPPSLWKRAVELFLRAVWEEYRSTYDEASAQSQFRSFREEFRLYSAFKVLKTVLAFVVHGTVGGVAIRSALAQAARTRLTEYLIARGATTAGLIAAEQIARKIAFYVELAFIAGCGAYCASLAYARGIIETTTAVIEGIAAVLNIVSGIAGAIATGVVRTVLTARATMDPTNWDLSPLPVRTRSDVAVVGSFVWSKLGTGTPDAFISNASRPLSSFAIPAVLVSDIARGLSQAATAQTGFNITFTPETLQQLTPLSFVQLLVDWRLLRYRQDPARLAEAGMAASTAP